MRLPFALLWVVMLVAALAVNIHSDGGQWVETSGMIGCCLIGQWLLVQLPLWVLVVFYRLKLRHADLALVGSDPVTGSSAFAN
ncbi:MAG TPA: hypothetical protein VMP01_08135 [Pirellulaceae bacterium]|nr:hypothetical protein [Pirellulaceae bacterium]